MIMHSKNIICKQKILKMHEVVSTEISRRFNLYTPSQNKIFKAALNLIDQLNVYLELPIELNSSSFNTLKELFRLLKKLNIKNSNCIFLNLRQKNKEKIQTMLLKNKENI